MKYLVSILSFSIIFFFSSCSEKSQDSEGDHSHAEEHSHNGEAHKHSHKADHSHSEYEVLLPKEGEKWEANIETTEGINTMAQKAQDFIDGNTMSPEYISLKEELEEDFQSIFDKCTMTGEAHQQLHNYLLPMKYMIEGLGSQDEKLAKEKLSELQDHLAEYSKYFK